MIKVMTYKLQHLTRAFYVVLDQVRLEPRSDTIALFLIIYVEVMFQSTELRRFFDSGSWFPEFH